MGIRITDEPYVYVSARDLNRYRYDYQQMTRYMAGPIPTFEDYVRQRAAETTVSHDQ